MDLSARKFLGLMAGGAVMSAVALGMASPASAGPGCSSGGSPWGGGGFCDIDYGADGSYLHCERVYVLGFGGENCYRVYPPRP